MSNQLTVLGSGICISSFHKKWDYRNPSGHLLQLHGKNILLDCADGIRRKMEEARFDYFTLDAICISHFHPDHFSIDALIQALYVRAKKAKCRKTLTIYGPKTVEKRIVELWNKKNIPSYEESFPGVLDITFVEYHDRWPVDLEEITITPYKVLHGKMDAYALRLSYDGKVLVYSGDCSSCKQIVEAARDADIFLCETGNDIGDEKSTKLIHLTPYQAGEMAQKAKAAKLILVHYSGKDSKPEMINEVKRAGYRGEIHIAFDLDNYSL